MSEPKFHIVKKEIEMIKVASALWFLILALIYLTIIVAGLYFGYLIVQDPASIGEFFGKIVRGYQDTANPSP